MNLYYENHKGEIIQFYNSAYVLTDHAFFDWSLSYSTVQSVSKGFKFDPATRQFKVRIVPKEPLAEDRDEIYRRLINEFCKVCSKDIEEPGRLWTTGGEYLICRIIASQKTGWVKGKDVLLTCQILSDYPVWIKERKYEFLKRESIPGGNTYLDYDYDYEYDYCSYDTGYVTINNESQRSANFKLIFYGGCNNPTITVDSVAVGVNTSLLTDEYLTIDSRNKTVIKTATNGDLVNLFNSRLKNGASIFSKIDPGQHSILWPGTFGFDLILYEERPEPEWNTSGEDPLAWNVYIDANGHLIYTYSNTVNLNFDIVNGHLVLGS